MKAKNRGEDKNKTQGQLFCKCFSVSVYVILLGILEPVDTDYSGGGLRGWLRALSRASVHISALLWNGCQLRLLGCDNGASIPLSVLCGNVSISL